MKSMKSQILRKPLNLAGKAKRKVCKSQILGKPQNLAVNPLKIKPNEKYEHLKNLKLSENLQIWLEILLKIKPNYKH